MGTLGAVTWRVKDPTETVIEISSAAKSRRPGGPGIPGRMKTDPRVDAYIAKAAAFARPILKEVRERIRSAWPTAEETIKWNAPFYVVGGKIFASMAAFKNHAKVGIWNGVMPSFVDVTKVSELPPAKSFAEQVKTAARRIKDSLSKKPSKGTPKAAAAAAPKKAAPSATKKTASKPAKKIAKKVAKKVAKKAAASPVKESPKRPSNPKVSAKKAASKSRR